MEGGAQHGPSGGRWDRELPSGEAKNDKGKRVMVQESRWQVPPNLGFSLQKHRGRKDGIKDISANHTVTLVYVPECRF